MAASHVYWGMPRRIRLDLDETQEGICSLCGTEAVPLVTEYETQAYGMNYEGPWIHPLTPYTHDEQEVPNPKKGVGGGLSYRHWQGLVVSSDSSSASPARNVEEFLSLGAQYEKLDEIFEGSPRLMAFGYETDNAKIRSWNHSEMPILSPEEYSPELEGHISDLVQVADHDATVLRRKLQHALYGSAEKTSNGKIRWDLPDHIDYDNLIFENAKSDFWRKTEPRFYNVVDRLVEAETRDEIDTAKRDWAGYLVGEVADIFDRVTQNGRVEMKKPRSVALARKELYWFTSPNFSEVRDILDLPEETKDSA
jgi:CRISPR system Cascade subunit CasA